MTLIEKAQDFAHKAHDSINQRRKYTNEPYWVHTDEVAKMVEELYPGIDTMICTAHLHDVLEDVPINTESTDFNSHVILEEFGPNVLRLVEELTNLYTKENYKNLTRYERHLLEWDRLHNISAAAQTIKLADIISNCTGLVKLDREFARVYLKEKDRLLPMLDKGNVYLYVRARNIVSNGLVELAL